MFNSELLDQEALNTSREIDNISQELLVRLNSKEISITEWMYDSMKQFIKESYFNKSTRRVGKTEFAFIAITERAIKNGESFPYEPSDIEFATYDRDFIDDNKDNIYKRMNKSFIEDKYPELLIKGRTNASN